MTLEWFTGRKAPAMARMLARARAEARAMAGRDGGRVQSSFGRKGLTGCAAIARG